jgi:hypothetical protein
VVPVAARHAVRTPDEKKMARKYDAGFYDDLAALIRRTADGE